MQGIEFPQANSKRTAGDNLNTNDLPVVVCHNEAYDSKVAFVVSKFKNEPRRIERVHRQWWRGFTFASWVRTQTLRREQAPALAGGRHNPMHRLLLAKNVVNL